MDYKEIEIEGMKEILKDKEEYIKKLEHEINERKESDSIINKKIIDLHNQVIELLEENKRLKECNDNLMKEVKLCYKDLNNN